MNAHILDDELNTLSSLETLGNVIMTSWETRLKNTLDPSKLEPEPILKDHMPDILMNLRHYLQDETAEQDSEFLGNAHGFQRAILTNFNLVDLMKEYSILREVLIFNLYPIGNMKGAMKLHRYLDLLLINSTQEFLKAKNIL